ncbi:RagB/SusD family nutrient uptake outer membrane protein [Flavobacterium subsaxonicum]|uniref:Carbohydrate-binding protein SusD n=1 Tax=Flavobacterium subsaxonicum WB 4.1-42 = DSM 21790 TaxID=1121898 RepID=A0A0A2MRT2_9FLAO|nr:RagB/SusD family nutrient uptake outer membrane protein [Flavobacterium subsaxonicum]KGO94286.1 carbohydrate-binding protein SusD [Flavobacterium subsaxonicum WB 4.1-42 = DSM 21790]
MKRYFKSYKVICTALAFALLSSACSEEFTNRASEDSISLESFYKNDDQVKNVTNGLYSRSWFQFANKFFYAVGEVGSGNMYSGSSDVSALLNFSMNGSDNELNNAWAALWGNVAQANDIINYLPERVGPEVSQDVLNNVIGEAYFIRATAYFYLVRLWGPVPIIENNTDYITSPKIPTAPIADVYKLIEMDYQKAIDNLKENIRTANYSTNMRVSKGSARSFLAKVYLYEKKYAEAKTIAETVINSGEFKLLGGSSLPAKSFADLFTYQNNNNEETIFALLWFVDGRYGSANNSNTQFGISTGALTTSNASYGGVFGPSQDVLNIWEAGDVRRKETIMLPGDTYNDIKVRVSGGTVVQTGFTVPAADEIGGQGAGAAIKKYVIGIADGTNTSTVGHLDGWNMMENNTYIMRYADLLLIHAEATLGGNSSTSDAGALASYNAVRNRAGLASKSSLTFDDIFQERRKELMFEGDYWYDLGRLPRAQATAIIAAQNRGDRFTPKYYTPSEDDFYLDYPDNEVSKNPLLMESPVPYTFE